MTVLTSLDQTDLQYFNPSNRFDAEGLTRIIGEIEEKRKALRAEKLRAVDVAMRKAMLPLERKVIALVRADTQKIRVSDESTDVRWFPVRTLPERLARLHQMIRGATRRRR